MAAVTGLVVLKRFPYRGNQEEYSNEYWLGGSVPADAAAWRALFDAMVLQEKTIYPAEVTVVGGYGYDSDDPLAHAVWTLDISAAPVLGTMSTAGATRMAGDAAVFARWKTSRLNTRGKPIYLRKYWHPAFTSTGNPVDTVQVTQLAAINAFATKMRDGTFIDGRTLRSRSHAEVLVSGSAGPYITTRTLKRRGKRPPT